MDFMHATMPGAIGDIHYGVAHATGWDRFVQLFTSRAYFRQRVAQKLAAAFPDPRQTITFTIGSDPSVWRVIRGLGKGRAAAIPWQRPR